MVADLGYHDLHHVNVERERADIVLMAAKRAFRLEEALMMSPADDERMLEILEPYIGQRARVQNLVKSGRSRPPRHGPRLSLTDLSGR